MILKFDDETERKSFLDRLERERRDIYAHCSSGRVLPDVVATDLDEEQEAWLLERLGSRAFRDVRFETF